MLIFQKVHLKFVRVTFLFVKYIFLFDHCFSEGPRVASIASYAMSCCGVPSEFTERCNFILSFLFGIDCCSVNFEKIFDKKKCIR